MARLFVGLLLLSLSCASTPHRSATASRSSSKCFANSTRCDVNADCCSLWCVNGYCERREP